MSFGNSSDFLLNLSVCGVDGEDKHFYRFKSFRLDIAERRLLNNDVPVPLMPKVFDVLALLVERHGHLVGKNELLDTVWADTFVEETNITRIIHELRKVLGEDKNGNKFIETVAKKGYRFVADVTEVSEPPAVAGGFPVDEKTSLPTPDLSVTADGSDTARPNTRIILFGIGFVSAVFLIFLLSFNFLSTSGDPNKIRSIAVLPLKPINKATRDEMYEIGIADSLIYRLGTMKGIIIRPLEATRKYSEVDHDPLAAGREQKADYVFASNYQIADGKIRITAQLYNVENGKIEETYKTEKDAGNIFALQDAIAVEIGNLLLNRFALTPNTTTTARRGTSNPEAFQLYVHGHFFANQETTEGFKKALEQLNKAIELDPNYALAYAALSRAYAGASEWHLPPREAMPKARVYAEQAVRLDETLPDGHVALAKVKMEYDRDVTGAERELKRALELNPNHIEARGSYSWLLSYMGRHQEAIEEAKRIEEIDPLRYGLVIYYFAGEYDQVISRAKKALEIEPNKVAIHQWLGMAYEGKGMYEEALASFQKAREIDDTPDLRAFQARVLALSGKRSEAIKILAELKELSKQQYISPYFFAIIYTGLNDKDEAIAWLEKAYEDRSYWLTGLALGMDIGPRLAPLRDDPRFQDFLQRVRRKPFSYNR